MGKTKDSQVVKRRTRNSLGEEAILDVAQSIAIQNQEISMRAVAGKLNCTPMAIYRYFPDKHTLLLALLDRLLSKIDFERKFKSPDEQLIYLANQHLQIIQANNWAIPLLFKNPSPGEAANRVGENFLLLLVEHGHKISSAFRVFSSIIALNYGWAGFTAGPRGESKDSGLLMVAEQETPDPVLFPLTSKSWKYLSNAGNAKDYRLTVRAILDIGK